MKTEEEPSQNSDPNNNMHIEANYDPNQLIFLTRLARLQKGRDRAIEALDPSDWRLRLIHKALFSTYRDCIEQGVGEEAKLLINQHPSQQER